MEIICYIVKQFSALWPWLLLISVGFSNAHKQKQMHQKAAEPLMRKEHSNLSLCRWKRASVAEAFAWRMNESPKNWINKSMSFWMTSMESNQKLNLRLGICSTGLQCGLFIAWQGTRGVQLQSSFHTGILNNWSFPSPHTVSHSHMTPRNTLAAFVPFLVSGSRFALR